MDVSFRMSFFLVLCSIHFLATLSYNKRLTLVGYEVFDQKFIRKRRMG